MNKDGLKGLKLGLNPRNSFITIISFRHIRLSRQNNVKTLSRLRLLNLYKSPWPRLHQVLLGRIASPENWIFNSYLYLQPDKLDQSTESRFRKILEKYLVRFFVNQDVNWLILMYCFNQLPFKLLSIISSRNIEI